MKKGALFFLGLIVWLSFSPRVLAVDTVSVAECTKYEHKWRSVVGVTLRQGFRPEYNRLSSIKLWLGGKGSVNWAIKAAEEGFRDIASGVITYDAPGELTASFDPVTVYPGDHYYLYISNPTENGSWAYTTDATCYSVTNAEENDAAIVGVGDFNFVIYGFNYVAEAAATDTPAETQIAATAAPASAETPSTNTTSSIEPPSDLTAVTQNSTVNLTWTASKTSDIDGYKIFRSTAKGASYKLISSTTKSLLKYTDSKVDAGTKYYYFVRAYKNDSESANSNIASTTVEKSLSASATPSTTVATFADTTTPAKKAPLYIYLIISVVVIAAGGGVAYFIIKKRKTKLTNSKPAAEK